MTASRLAPFGTTIFSAITAEAQRHGAINLAQGFPDFDGPGWIVEAAVEAMRAGQNQYARSMGRPDLVTAIAARYASLYGLDLNPMTEVCVTSGATEGIAAALVGLLEPDDELLVFEPCYDSYAACAALAGARLACVPLRFPRFELDVGELRAAMGPRTRAILLNSPHNPTGKVFSPEELAMIAELCVERDVIAITDEVYEHLTYDGHRHVPLATLPGMRERTLTLSSAGKTFALTGWKVGWVVGPAPLVAAVHSAHQFLTFCSATPLQAAMARALAESRPEFYEQQRADYLQRRDFLAAALTAAGFRVALPEGSYFIMADYGAISDLDDRSFVSRLIAEQGVAAIPPGVFYPAHPQLGQRLVRFAFCKTMPTLTAAAERLAGLRSSWPVADSRSR